MSMLIRWFQRITALFAALTAFFGIGSKTVSFSFYAMPSSGYSWSYYCSDNGILECTDSYYKANISVLKNENDGKQYFVFKAKNRVRLLLLFSIKTQTVRLLRPTLMYIP